MLDLNFETSDRKNNGKPSLDCSYTEDSFTVNSNNGNGRLTYPVGLLTSDELVLAGKSTSNYLETGQNWWSISPGNLLIYRVTNIDMFTFDGLSGITSSLGIRPSVSLIPGIKVISGDGSSSDPYVVDKQ